MKNEKRNYVAVGTFVIAMAVVLIVWISLMAGQMGATDQYSVVYRNVGKLKPGAQVLFEGFPVGVLSRIVPFDQDNHRMFRVELDVEKGWPIPVDSTARIATGIFAAPVIDIEGGDSTETLSPGSMLPGQEATDIMGTLKTTAGKLEPVLEELGRTAPLLLKDAEQLLAELRGAAVTINTILSPENVTRVSDILKNFDQATNETNQLLEQLRKASANAAMVVSRLDKLVEKEGGNVSQAINDTQHTMATVARHIDSIASNLEDTTRNLNEFSKQLRTNPAVLIRGREASKDGSWSK